MQTAKRTAVTKTELPPCCLRVHPADHTLVILGTYKLEKESGLRHGSLDVYRMENGQFQLLESQPTALAVLDLKFSPDGATLVLAHSTGNVTVWKYTESLEKVKDIQVLDTESLATSVFFAPANPNTLLVTSTSGEACMLDLTTQESTTFDGTHTLECWTGAFGEAGPARDVVFTGGDDGRLLAHDLRSNSQIWSTNHRHHDAGVVLVLCPGEKWLAGRPNDLWTGSYDDCLRVFDLRKLDGENGPYLYSSLLPQETQKENLNGGVWRLIPAPDSDDVLACCMYDGARIIHPKDGDFEVARYFKGDHESMCYGGDWQAPGTVVTCSFYDNVVQLWLPTETVNA